MIYLLRSLNVRSALYYVEMLVLAVERIGSQTAIYLNSILTVDIYEVFVFSGID